MSAAEKLKGLDKVMPHAPTHIATWPLFWEYRNALPQIVAVVEAAEEYAEDGDRMYATEHERKTHAALAALDEKLA